VTTIHSLHLDHIRTSTSPLRTARAVAASRCVLFETPRGEEGSQLRPQARRSS
jgi:hypothetical protein